MADGRERRDGHAAHDLLMVAALLDRDAVGEDRAIAESWLTSCTPCGALHADLLALLAATVSLPTPPRTRAFTLSSADAARLAAPATGEPSVQAPRLGGVMTDLNTPAHAAHDRMLVASLADHSIPPAERAAGETLVSSCADCAALHADLLALRTATQAMPTPSRTRDFALTRADATRLRSAGWRRFFATLGSSRDALSRPLAVGLTTLGLAGLLVATVPSVLTGYGGATSSSPEVLSTVGGPIPGASSSVDTAGSGDGVAASPASAAAAASAAPQPVPVVPGYGVASSPGAEPSDERAAIRNQAASPAPGTEAAMDGSAKGETGGAPSRGREPDLLQSVLPGPEDAGFSTLVVLSGAFLIAGLSLFAIRWTARRFGDD
ncbi:MAG: hypothetical protein ABI562_02305 [Chloroflexota bacterium]